MNKYRILANIEKSGIYTVEYEVIATSKAVATNKFYDFIESRGGHVIMIITCKKESNKPYIKVEFKTTDCSSRFVYTDIVTKKFYTDSEEEVIQCIARYVRCSGLLWDGKYNIIERGEEHVFA